MVEKPFHCVKLSRIILPQENCCGVILFHNIFFQINMIILYPLSSRNWNWGKWNHEWIKLWSKRQNRRSIIILRMWWRQAQMLINLLTSTLFGRQLRKTPALRPQLNMMIYTHLCATISTFSSGNVSFIPSYWCVQMSPSP